MRLIQDHEFDLPSSEWIKAKRTRDMIEKTCVDHHKQSFQMRWHGPFTYHDVGTTFFEGVEWTDVVVDRFCTYVSQLSTTEPPFVESAFAASQMFDVEYNDLCIEAINKRMELGEKYEVPGWGTLLAKGEEVVEERNAKARRRGRGTGPGRHEDGKSPCNARNPHGSVEYSRN